MGGTRNIVKTNPATIIAFHSSSCDTFKAQKPKLQFLLLKNQNSISKDLHESNIAIRGDITLKELNLFEKMKCKLPHSIFVSVCINLERLFDLY